MTKRSIVVSTFCSDLTIGKNCDINYLLCLTLLLFLRTALLEKFTTQHYYIGLILTNPNTNTSPNTNLNPNSNPKP